MRKKTLMLIAAALAATAATGGLVYAQVIPHGPTRAEAQTMAAMAFDRLDVNVDGQLDAADGAEAREDRMRARFSAADSNGDSALAYDEFAAAGAEMRERFAEGRFEERRGHGERGRHGQGGFEHRGFGNDGAGLMLIAYTADANGDKAVSQSEYNAAVLSHFDRADANDDGVMTREEAQAYRQTLRTEAQARRAQAGPAAQSVPGS